MVAALVDDQLIPLDLINEPMFEIDPAGPHTGEDVFKRFRLAKSFMWSAGDILD